MQRSLGLRAARIWERLSDDQRAETRYQTVIDLEGDNHEALAALERIYRQRGDATLLAEMLLKRAGLEDNIAKRKSLLTEAAGLYQDRLPMSSRRSRRGRRSSNSMKRMARRCLRWQSCITVVVASRSWYRC